MLTIEKINFVIFIYFLTNRCSQNGDISYEVLYTIDDQSLPAPFTHNSRCPPESKIRLGHQVIDLAIVCEIQRHNKTMLYSI